MSFNLETKTLVQVIQDLSSAKTLEKITFLVRKAARKLADADGVTFVLKDQGMCSYVDEDAIAPLWKGQKFPLQACVSGWAMLNKQTVIIEDIFNDSRVPVDVYRPTFVKSMAITPIRQDDPIAAIGTYWKEQRKPSLEQQELLQALANSASTALENLQLYNTLTENIIKLKKSNQAKDEFLMNLSHELRTPLNAIIGWSEILTEDSSDKEQLKEGLQIILKNSNHQLSIVEDLLDSTRILIGRIQLHPEVIDVQQVVKQAIAAQHATIQKKNILVDFKSEFNSATISADPVRLRQIIDNVLVNALKFSFKDSQISLHLRKQGPHVEISVRDHGEGIDSSFLPFIFDRLRQADGSLTRRHGGMGLGLSIAKHLAEASNGTIEAHSPGMGQGSTFTVKFPLEKFDLKSERSRPLENIHVLVVDDDDDARQVAALALRNQGARVNMASSVQEALKIKSTDDFEVILCDLSMPEEDGFSLVRKIREGKTQFQEKIPVLALTAFTDKGTREKALHEGFDLFMEKPFRAASLVSTVAGVLA